MGLKLFLASMLSLLTLGLFTATAAAQFNPLSQACQQAPSSPACQQNAKQNGQSTNPAVDTIRTAANLIAAVAGVGAVIIIIISGFMFVTAGGAAPGQRAGDPNRIKSARATLTAAIIGLVVIALAWTIVTLVTNRLVKT